MHLLQARTTEEAEAVTKKKGKELRYSWQGSTERVSLQPRSAESGCEQNCSAAAPSLTQVMA